MPIVCTTCGHSREAGESGPAALCPACGQPYSAAAIRALGEVSPPPATEDLPPDGSLQIVWPDEPMKMVWPRVLRVEVVDLDIGFLSLVWIFIKAAIAMIPAAIILGFLSILFFASIGSPFLKH